MNRPDSSTSAKRSSRSGMSGSYCALTSTSGIISTGTTSGETTEHQPGRDETNGSDHSVVDPTEILVYGSVTRSDTPADAREHEAPDRGTGQGQHRVAAEGGAEHPGGDRDERADQGRQ